MRKRLLLFIFFIVSLNTSVFATVFNGPTDISWRMYGSLVVNGPAKLRLIRAQSMEINGTLKFHKIGISGKSIVNGEVNGDYGQFGHLTVVGAMNVDHVMADDLSVKGPVNGTSLDVKNQAFIEGPLNLRQCEFNDITVTADKIVLDEVIAANIDVLKSSSQTSPVIVLKGETTISGNISFESNNGLVRIEGDKVRFKGKVQGGELQRMVENIFSQ